MTETELQDTLMNLIETLIEAREETDGDDDEGTLADYARDMASDAEELVHVGTFERAMLLTSNHGLVLRTKEGEEFQLTIVRSR